MYEEWPKKNSAAIYFKMSALAQLLQNMLETHQENSVPSLIQD